MSHIRTLGRPPAGAKRWVYTGGLALLAVVTGVLFPRLMGGPALPTPPVSVARADQPGGELSYTPPVLPEAPDPAAILARLGGTAAVLLGGALLALWCGRRWLVPAAGQAGKTGQRLQLLDSLVLGNRCQVFLVEVDRRQVLIGTDATGLQTVVPLPESFASALGDGTRIEAGEPDGGAAPQLSSVTSETPKGDRHGCPAVGPAPG